MRILKDGIKTWCVTEVEDSPYFLSVEYRMIRQNQPVSFLPMQLKEEDGKKMMLYETTAFRNLKTKESLKAGECIGILESMLTLQKDIERHMLKIGQVLWNPEYVFFRGDEIRWIYQPEDQEDIAMQIEGFFSWILSMLDYDDNDTVRFMYQVFWKIRSRGFSGELVAQCLARTKKPQPDRITAFTWEDGAREGAYGAAPPVPEKNTAKKAADPIWKKAAAIIPLIILGLMLSGCILTGILYGFTYRTGGELAGCVLLFASWIMFRKGRLQKKKEKTMKAEKEIKQSQEGFSMPSGYAIWEDEEDGGKTEILATPLPCGVPYLQALSSGEITEIDHNPFHIGSEESLNHLVLSTKTISRQHAVIFGSSSGYFLQDLSSTNGTWLDHRQLIPEDPVLLTEDCEIRFAGEQFLYKSPHPG